MGTPLEAAQKVLWPRLETQMLWLWFRNNAATTLIPVLQDSPGPAVSDLTNTLCQTPGPGTQGNDPGRELRDAENLHERQELC